MQRTREEIFEILVREHEPALRAFLCVCVHDQAAADDLVQESFVAAWQELDRYDERRPFAAWLRGIARHKLQAYLRDRASAQRNPLLMPPDALDALSDEFGRLVPRRGDVFAETLAALRDCLVGLAAVDREIIQRVYRDKSTCQSLAPSLHLAVEAVKKRLQRARAQLRDCILGKLQAERSYD